MWTISPMTVVGCRLRPTYRGSANVAGSADLASLRLVGFGPRRFLNFVQKAADTRFLLLDRSKPVAKGLSDIQSCPGDYGCSAQGFVEQDSCYYDDGCNVPYYQTTGNCCYALTPILIDIDGDGLDLTDAAHGVLLEFIGDGKKERMPGRREVPQMRGLCLIATETGRLTAGRRCSGTLQSSIRQSILMAIWR